jgi:hypothetical protein
MLAAIHTQTNNRLLISNRHLLQQHKLVMPGIDINKLILCSVKNSDPVGWSGLVAAVIRQAGLDVLRGDEEAAEWLLSEQCRDYCQALGFKHENIELWLEQQINAE